MHTPRGICLLLTMTLGLAAAGCGQGPAVLKGDRLDYNVSVQKSNNEELLLNLVRARYAESIFFLQVGSISSSFTYAVNAAVAGTLYDNPSGVVSNSMSPSIGGEFAERPTITYTPVQGAQAVKQLMGEVTLERFVLLYRAEFSIESLMWTLVHRIGPMHNFETGSTAGTGAPYIAFLDFAGLMGRMQRRGDLEFMGTTEDGGAVLWLRFKDTDEIQAFSRLTRRSLTTIADPAGGRVGVVRLSPVSAPVAAAPDSGDVVIPIKLKSCYQVIYNLAWGVHLPVADAHKDYYLGAAPVESDLHDRGGPHAGLIRVHYRAGVPSDAFVAVPYRGGWYYIEDADVRSKSYLMLVRTLFSLQAGNIDTNAPLLTLPVNR